jgi:hypothetical protein
MRFDHEALQVRLQCIGQLVDAPTINPLTGPQEADIKKESRSDYQE